MCLFILKSLTVDTQCLVEVLLLLASHLDSGCQVCELHIQFLRVFVPSFITRFSRSDWKLVQHVLQDSTKNCDLLLMELFLQWFISLQHLYQILHHENALECFFLDFINLGLCSHIILLILLIIFDEINWWVEYFCQQVVKISISHLLLGVVVLWVLILHLINLLSKQIEIMHIL